MVPKKSSQATLRSLILLSYNHSTLSTMYSRVKESVIPTSSSKRGLLHVVLSR